MNSHSSERKIWLDTAKGIAIFSIVLGHMLPSDSTLRQILYSFHVPVFFIISGMLLSINYNKWSNTSFKTIALKKVKDYMYPYIMFSVASIISGFIFNGKDKAILAIKQTFMLEGYITLWFLPALLFSELIFILLYKKIKNIKVNFIIILAIIVVTKLFSVLYHLPNISPLNREILNIGNEINRALIATAFIYFGFYFNIIFDKFINSKLYSKLYVQILAISGLLIVNVCLMFFENPSDLHYSVIGNPLLYYSKAICLSVFIIYLCKLLDFIKKYNVIAFWGRNSLIIFATHLNFPVIFFASCLNFFFGYWMTVVITMMLETVTILIVNKWFKFLINFKELTLIIEKIKSRGKNNNL